MTAHGYKRNEYGQLRPMSLDYALWQEALDMVEHAVRKKKLTRAYDTISFDRKRRADGSAVHHEIYDIHPDPFKVLLCIRETEGNKYGVKTTSKTYYILKKHGRGVSVKETKKSIAAKASKSAECELGCAINVLEGKSKLQIKRACQDGIAYKKVAVVDDNLQSIYDGSDWNIGVERSERAMKNHNGGLYVYETKEEAEFAEFPLDSVNHNAKKVIVKCKVSGNYVRYESGKLAFSNVTPIEIV